MLDVVNEYSVDFEVKFGLDKSLVMVVNEDNDWANVDKWRVYTLPLSKC